MALHPYSKADSASIKTAPLAQAGRVDVLLPEKQVAQLLAWPGGLVHQAHRHLQRSPKSKAPTPHSEETALVTPGRKAFYNSTETKALLQLKDEVSATRSAAAESPIKAAPGKRPVLPLSKPAMQSAIPPRSGSLRHNGHGSFAAFQAKNSKPLPSSSSEETFPLLLAQNLAQGSSKQVGVFVALAAWLRENAF